MGIKFTIERREETTKGKVAYGTLKWAEKGLQSGVISGPYGKSELPEGLYQAMKNGLAEKLQKDGFCDSLKNCWFQLLTPQFSTIRTGLGIHPDGNLVGTQGCIGLLDADTKAWYDAFKSIPNGGFTVVEVVDKTV